MLARFCRTALLVRSVVLYCISLFSADLKKYYVMSNKNRALFCRVRFFQMLFWCGCFCAVLFCRRVIVRVFVSSHGKTSNVFFWYAILMFCIFGVTLIWSSVNFDFAIFSLNLICSFVDIPNLGIWQYVLVMSQTLSEWIHTL